MQVLPSQFNVAHAREKLAELDAEFFVLAENTDTPLIDDSEVSIAWKVSEPEVIPSLRWYLELYTWPTNTSEQKYVDNPTIKGQDMLGTWRQAFVREVKRVENNSDVYYIVLTLRKGYLTTILSGAAIDWSEARLDNSRELPPGTSTVTPGGNTTSEFIIVKWNNVSPFNVESVKDELISFDADSFAPTIRDEVIGTSYHRLYVTSNIENDGSATVSLLLAQPEYVLESFATWHTSKQTNVIYHWDVPRTIAQALIDAEQGTGKTVVPSYSSTEGLVDIVVYEKSFETSSLGTIVISDSCDNTVYLTPYWNVAYNAIGSYDCPAYSSGIEYWKDVSNNGDGAYDVFIRARIARRRDYPLKQSMESIMTESWEELAINVTSSDTSIPDISSIPVGTIYRQRRTPNDNCTSNFQTSYDYGIYADVPEKRTMAAKFESRYSSTLHNNASVDDTTSFEVGYIRMQENALNAFGLYDINKTVRMAANGGFYDIQSNVDFFSVQYDSLVRNQAAEYAAPDHAAGFIYVASNDMNDFGLYDAKVIVKAAVERTQVNRRSRSTMFENDAESIYRNAATSIAIGDHDPGYIREASSVFNEFGLYDSTHVERAAKMASVDTLRTALAGTQDEYSYAVRNSMVPYALPDTAVVGKVEVASSNLNDFGVYDIATQSRVSKPVSFESTFNDVGGTAWIRVFRNVLSADLAAWIGALPANRNNSVSLYINDDLTYSGQMSYTVATSGAGIGATNADWYEYKYKVWNDPTGGQILIHWNSLWEATSANAASKMTGQYLTKEPRYAFGLWEAVYADSVVNYP